MNLCDVVVKPMYQHFYGVSRYVGLRNKGLALYATLLLDEHNMNACSKAELVLPFIRLALLLPPDATVFDVACSIFLIARVSIVPYFGDL